VLGVRNYLTPNPQVVETVAPTCILILDLLKKVFNLVNYTAIGHAMPQTVSCWPLTAESRVRTRFSLCGICSGQRGTVTGFSPISSVFLQLVIIPSLLHTHLSPPHEVCDSSDEVTHCHTLGPKLGASSLTRHLVGLGVKQYIIHSDK
jgi:hypothetical protein